MSHLFKKPIPGSLINRAHPMAQSCSLFWIFTNNPYDYIKNQKVSLGSATAYVPTGLYFPGGSSSTTKVATISSLNLGTIHTLCVRINPAAVSGNVFAGATSYYAFNLYLGTTIYYAAGSGNNVYVNYTMSLNVPTNFVIVRDNASVSFYVNGVKISTTKTLGSNNNLTISALGGYADGSGLLNATIEYAAIFSNIASVDIVEQMHADPYSMFRPKEFRLWSVPSEIVVRKDCVIPYEVLETVQADSPIPYETLAVIQADSPIPYETLAVIQADTPIHYEALTVIQADAPILYEVLAGIQADFQFLYDTLAAIGANFQIPYEHDGKTFRIVWGTFSLASPLTGFFLASPLTEFSLQSPSTEFELIEYTGDN